MRATYHLLEARERVSIQRALFSFTQSRFPLFLHPLTVSFCLPSSLFTRYTSPHLLEARERIRVGSVPISRDDFARHFWECWDLLEKNPSKDPEASPMPTCVHACISSTPAQRHCLQTHSLVSSVQYVGCSLGRPWPPIGQHWPPFWLDEVTEIQPSTHTIRLQMRACNTQVLSIPHSHGFPRVCCRARRRCGG